MSCSPWLNNTGLNRYSIALGSSRIKVEIRINNRRLGYVYRGTCAD